MLLSLIKLYARFAIKIYCPRIVINKPELLNIDGPVLLAANHPNSFLDGMILTTLFRQPVYALARGDAFNHPLANKILRWLRQLPVYRTREGAENLSANYITFSACRKVFEKNGIVLIFSEAGCVNEWQLRPLKKGTARLAISSWQSGINLKVIPVGINYSSFKKFGKTVHIYFGNTILPQQIAAEPTEAKQLLHFNAILKKELQKHVYQVTNGNKQTVLKKFDVRLPAIKKAILLLPAVIGFITHFLFFYAVWLVVQFTFKNSDHYDSVLTALVVLLYPLYLILVFILLLPYGLLWAFLSLLILPFSAWAFMQLRPN